MYICLILSVPLQYNCKNTTEHLQFNKLFGTFRKVLIFFFFCKCLLKRKTGNKSFMNMTCEVSIVKQTNKKKSLF